MTPAKRLSATFAACALAASLLVASEGWVLKTAPDPIGIPTSCAGVTGIPAKTYTDEQCVALTAQAMLKHGLEIGQCLKVPISDQTRAAFLSFAYNVGTSAFCSSTLARKANAGDLKGACAELSKWVYAGKRVLPGLVRRRKAERELCEAGL